MSSIVVYFKDGSEARFPHEGRAGGSYTKTVKYEGSFAIVTDEWGNRTAYPAEDIDRVEEKPGRW